MTTKLAEPNALELSPILAAHDVALAMKYSTEKLGFDLVGQMSEPIEYAILSFDNFSVHFKRIDRPLIANGAFDGNLNAGKGGVYIVVNDVDALAHQLVRLGAADSLVPEDKQYGMRGFWIADPFGYAVTFGARLDR